MNDDLDLTKDSLYDGRLVCYQNRIGYRFSIDSVLLAHFSLHWKKADVLDLGCGCGILGLLLLHLNEKNINSVVGVEIQESLKNIAVLNCNENLLNRKMTILHDDYRQLKTTLATERFSHVICNPPFYKAGSGRQSSNPVELTARHQCTTSLEEIVNSIAYHLKNKGLVSLIYPAEILTELITSLNTRHIEVKRLRIVYSYPESTRASLVLVEGSKNGGIGLQILPPLFIYVRKNGNYTEEIRRMYCP